MIALIVHHHVRVLSVRSEARHLVTEGAITAEHCLAAEAVVGPCSAVRRRVGLRKEQVLVLVASEGCRRKGRLGRGLVLSSHRVMVHLVTEEFSTGG